MRLGIISDTHYGFSKFTHRKLEKVLEKNTEDSFDVLIHAGDWISHKQKSLIQILSLFRKHYPNKPILGVLGNHDYWDEKKDYSLGKYFDIFSDHEKLFLDFDITYLQNKPYTLDKYTFYGFDGWYYEVYPKTNDIKYMPVFCKGLNVSEYLRDRAEKSFVNILNTEKQSEHEILVTHFPPFTDNIRYLEYCANSSYYKFITERFNTFIVGHSHVACDYVKDSCRIVNSGSDYDKAVFKVITI